jgi:LysR family hydrogen peroxide-inducible transcriptional activator
VAIKKLEEELDVKIFERSAGEVSVTSLGEEIVRQAQSVLEQANEIKEIAKRGKDPLSGVLTLGVIYTIGPYLLPDLVRNSINMTPQMPLMLQENFTVKLLEMLRTGDRLRHHGRALPGYRSGTGAAVRRALHGRRAQHPPAGAEESLSTTDLKNETMLLLGAGHCFRDHVLEVCPEFARYASNSEGIRRTFEGSSLETIKYMVAAGMGVTLVPRPVRARGCAGSTERRRRADEPHIRYLPIHEEDGIAPPTRRVVLAWRRSFTRYEAIAALRNAVYACPLPGVQRLSQ